MEKMGRMPDLLSAEEVDTELQADPEMLEIFRKLPTALWGRHFDAMEKIAKKAAPGEVRQLQMEYLFGIVSSREDAIVEYQSKDAFFQNASFSEGDSAKGFQQQLHELLVSEDRTLGAGQTARVKSLQLEGLREPVAVKYLITPTEKTLSAEGEHDMLYEVEVVTSVEQIEAQVGAGKYLRVPHPYFYYKRGPLQCYGMSQVRGVNIEELLTNTYSPFRNDVIEALRRRYGSDGERGALDAEIDSFMKAVHKVCLHGDIKPKNIMIDTDGVFYLIDFGQSVPANSETEKAREQFDNLREHEPAVMRECIRGAFNYLREQDMAAAA